MENNKIKVKIDPKIEEGTYANAVSVQFNGNECIIDFGYKIPNTPDPTIKIVSRINLNHKTAESFTNLLTNTMLDWKNKNKKHN